MAKWIWRWIRFPQFHHIWIQAAGIRKFWNAKWLTFIGKCFSCFRIHSPHFYSWPIGKKSGFYQARFSKILFFTIVSSPWLAQQYWFTWKHSRKPLSRITSKIYKSYQVIPITSKVQSSWQFDLEKLFLLKMFQILGRSYLKFSRTSFILLEHGLAFVLVKIRMTSMPGSRKVTPTRIQILETSPTFGYSNFG